MARLVNMLIPSVRDAQEWLRKTQLHQEEGEESQGDALGLVALGSADSRVGLQCGRLCCEQWSLTVWEHRPQQL